MRNLFTFFHIAQILQIAAYPVEGGQLGAGIPPNLLSS